MARGERSLLFLSWGAVPGRSQEIAAALGGEAWSFRPGLIGGKRLAPLRWLVQALATAAVLARRRPAPVIATNPPIWLGLICLAYARLTRCPFVLDSHPGGFGVQEDRVAARVQRLHAYVARRSAAVLVTDDHWAEVVRGWGGRPLEVWEAPPPWSVAAKPAASDGPLHALYVGVFSEDEPVEVVIEAAAGLDGAEVRVTGDTGRAPAGLVAAAPPTVRFTGYLRGGDYVAALEWADVLVCLTHEPTSVMRAACEAVWAHRALVVTDTPAARRAFPYARYVANDPAELAAALRDVRNGPDTTAEAYVAQAAAWEIQCGELGRRLGLGAGPTAADST